MFFDPDPGPDPDPDVRMPPTGDPGCRGGRDAPQVYPAGRIGKVRDVSRPYKFMMTESKSLERPLVQMSALCTYQMCIPFWDLAPQRLLTVGDGICELSDGG